MIKLCKDNFNKLTLFILLSVAFLSLPSALTIEKVDFERILSMFIPLIIIVALGAEYLWNNLRLRFSKNLLPILIIFIFIYSLNYLYFLDQYFTHNPKKNDAWQMGYRQIIEKVTPIQNRYEKIIVQQSLEQPYIFFLFYQKYDPLKYQAISKEVFIPNREGKDMGLVSGIDNIKFEDINWSKEKPQGNTLYIMPIYKLDQQSKFYFNFKVLDEVKDLNGFPLFKIVKI